jgi:DNA-binding MarR family transcriptional regulator
MTALPGEAIPEDILNDSVLAHIAAAYFALGKRLERETQCSTTRGFILATLRSGAVLNQNQIATSLGLDRTVVHRAIKSLAEEGLVSERKAKSGRAIEVHLTVRGRKYRERLIEARKAADESIRLRMTKEDAETLLRLLKLVAE